MPRSADGDAADRDGVPPPPTPVAMGHKPPCAREASAHDRALVNGGPPLGPGSGAGAGSRLACAISLFGYAAASAERLSTRSWESGVMVMFAAGTRVESTHCSQACACTRARGRAFGDACRRATVEGEGAHTPSSQRCAAPAPQSTLLAQRQFGHMQPGQSAELRLEFEALPVGGPNRA